MINGMPIFYSSKTGSGLKPVQTKKGKGLEPVQTKKGKGLEPVQTKKGGSCNKKCNKKRINFGGLIILK